MTSITLMERVEELPDFPTLEETAKALGYSVSRLQAGGRSKDLPYVEAILNRATGTYSFKVVKSSLMAYLRGDDIGRERTLVIISPDGVMLGQQQLKALLNN